MKRRSGSSRPPTSRRRRPGRRGAGRKLLALFGLLLLAALAAGGALWSWSRGPTLPGDVLEVNIAQGLNVEQLSQELARLGVVKEPQLFSLYLRLRRQEHAVQPGLHLLRPGLSPAALAVKQRTLRSVRTLIESGIWNAALYPSAGGT